LLLVIVRNILVEFGRDLDRLGITFFCEVWAAPRLFGVQLFVEVQGVDIRTVPRLVVLIRHGKCIGGDRFKV
jgi:hypothetical protein